MVVHRLLLAGLQEQAEKKRRKLLGFPPSTDNQPSVSRETSSALKVQQMRTAEYEDLATHLNSRTRDARNAQRESMTFFLLLYIKHHNSLMGMTDNSEQLGTKKRDKAVDAVISTSYPEVREKQKSAAEKSGCEYEAYIWKVHADSFSVIVPMLGIKVNFTRFWSS